MQVALGTSAVSSNYASTRQSDERTIDQFGDPCLRALCVRTFFGFLCFGLNAYTYVYVVEGVLAPCSRQLRPLPTEEQRRLATVGHGQPL